MSKKNLVISLVNTTVTEKENGKKKSRISTWDITVFGKQVPQKYHHWVSGCLGFIVALFGLLAVLILCIPDFLIKLSGKKGFFNTESRKLWHKKVLLEGYSKSEITLSGVLEPQENQKTEHRRGQAGIRRIPHDSKTRRSQ